MTPMLRELHEARKARLPRMGARLYSNAVVPVHRVRPVHQPEPVPQAEPAVAEIKDEPKPACLTPLEEIESPVIVENTSVTMQQIKIVVAKRYKVSVQEIISDSRSQAVMLPRQIAYALARRLTNKALTTIGPAFGGRDHTTVLHGVRKIEKRARKDAEFAAELTQLEQVIMGTRELPCPCCGSLAPTGPDDDGGDDEADCS